MQVFRNLVVEANRPGCGQRTLKAVFKETVAGDNAEARELCRQGNSGNRQAQHMYTHATCWGGNGFDRPPEFKACLFQASTYHKSRAV